MICQNCASWVPYGVHGQGVSGMELLVRCCQFLRVLEMIDEGTPGVQADRAGEHARFIALSMVELCLLLPRSLAI